MDPNHDTQDRNEFIERDMGFATFSVLTLFMKNTLDFVQLIGLELDIIKGIDDGRVNYKRC